MFMKMLSLCNDEHLPAEPVGLHGSSVQILRLSLTGNECSPYLPKTSSQAFTGFPTGITMSVCVCVCDICVAVCVCMQG